MKVKQAADQTCEILDHKSPVCSAAAGKVTADLAKVIIIIIIIRNEYDYGGGPRTARTPYKRNSKT